MSQIECLERAITLAAKVFEIEQSKVTSGTSVENLEQWTSLGHVRLILALEKQICRSLDVDEIIQATSIKGIANILLSVNPRNN